MNLKNHPSTLEAEEEELQVPGQPEINSETSCQKKSDFSI
jgi:hypothetical protein